MAQRSSRKERRALLFTLVFLYAVISLVLASCYLFFSLRRSQPPPGATGTWERASSPRGICASRFYRFYSAADDRWLGHSSGGVYGDVPEKTLGVVPGLWEGVYAIQAWSSLFLSVHPDGSVGIDRPVAKSAEMWKFHSLPGSADGTVAIWSVGKNCFLRIVGGRLMCDVKNIASATHWVVHAEPNKTCRFPMGFEDWNTVARACWKPGLPVAQEKLDKKLVVFGTLRPLKSLKPNETNKHDPFAIANRTLFNWALIEGVQPVVFSDKPLDHELIDKINRELDTRAIGRQIHVIKEFEIHPEFGIPTYRGLFLRVLSAYPDVQNFMYSNMDILFTRDTVKTIGAVNHCYRTANNKKGLLEGWFAVGRRTNVDVSLNSSLGEDWEQYLKSSLEPRGTVFQSFSEDYFAMSRGMFDWNKVPDFVVGGTAFDNWLTTQAVLRASAGFALTVETTLTLTAIHQNHEESVKASHRHPKSRYNNLLAHRTGGWALGHTTDAPLLTIHHLTGDLLVLDRFAVLIA